MPGTDAQDVRIALVFGLPILVIGLLAFDEGGYEVIARQQLALAIWWLLALGFAFGIIPRSNPPRTIRVVAWAAVGFGALQLASVAWGPSDERAIEDACRTAGYLGILALAWNGLGPRSWSYAGAGLFAIASLVTAYALLTRLAPDLTGTEVSLDGGRLGEPLGYWNALAAWAAATLAMGLAWSADARRQRTRMVAAAVIPIAATVLYLTYSRGGVLACALGIGVVISLSRNRPRAGAHALAAVASTAFCVLAIRSQPEIAVGTGTEGALMVGLCVLIAAGGCALVSSTTRRMKRGPGESSERSPRLALVFAGLLVAGLATIALVAGRDGFGRGGDAAEYASDDPSARLVTAAGNRSAYWSEALDGFGEQPLRGEGSGSFVYRWAAEGSEAELVSDPHSLPFAVASELGLLGLLTLAALLTGLTVGAVRGLAAAQRSAPAVALVASAGVFLLSTAIDWTWEATALAAFGLACAGTVTMAAASPRRNSRDTKPGPLRTPRWGLAAAAVALGAMQVPGIVASDSLRDSEGHREIGDTAAAISDADRALDAAPWSAAAYAARAEAELDAEHLGSARADALAAIEREPRDAEHRILLAEIESARSRLRAAVRALREAAVLSPHEARLRSKPVRSIIALCKTASRCS